LFAGMAYDRGWWPRRRERMVVLPDPLEPCR
jgi:hypothetical protein